ncbi:HAD-superfamily hydrolase protein [Klebsormidium nitens]|uniref:HAD-superfamily hydrolase protein n=1 Tax=Klebsormidium nitens TaxID=105231 RepID=A0A1Y1I025_KLENI|nr:HAD-superfamily hydrolase protein [Klebsormidium nitens]|eukprot:GAQ84264.1 HAD-superfamily hydrolase protein [Klebsormidium nitens]
MTSLAAKFLVIFDFDWTLIDDNSDTYVVEQLGAGDLMLSLRKELPWTQLMDRMMHELHLRGRTLPEIDACLPRIPLHKAMDRAIRGTAALGCSLHIVSDANSHFIATILAAHDLTDCFSSVHTNPAEIDSSGALRVFPFHSLGLPPHGCPLCPPNMCKGLILDKLVGDPRPDGLHVIYLGVGGGDYCPSLRLRRGDHVLARAGFPLLKRLQNVESGYKSEATVHVWDSAEDVERLLLGRIPAATGENRDNDFLSELPYTGQSIILDELQIDNCNG